MTRNRWLVLGTLLLVGAGVWLYLAKRGNDAPSYRLARVERGDLEATVSATGKLGAVTTVQVGTQVSGQVAEIKVDFNDRVTKGQLIARIDPTLQQQAVRDAQAGLDRARAELEKAQRDDQRNRRLFEQELISESDLNAADYALDVARASLKSAQVALERARQNLDYTSIHAPIDGIVVERNVDVGQTVAASLSAPQLFLIANDLARLQILAAVDESDIGSIQQDQAARFTVQAYPNERFTGRVRQVRLQSTTTENVVNYTAVVEVENPDGKLLPGMTATVDFLVGSAQDVLAVPNAALRFRPTEAMLAALREGGDSARPPGSTAAGTTGGRRPRAAGGAGRSADQAALWVVDAAGNVRRIAVRTGLSDGQRTEVRGEGLEEGMQVIVGAAQAGQTPADAGAASPFGNRSPRSGPPRPGGF